MRQIIIKGTNNKNRIVGYVYDPISEPKAIVYFAHGVTEYAQRHEHFYTYLANIGYMVIANDHMGHGESGSEAPMYFTGKDDIPGWEIAVDDAAKFINQIKTEHPDLPVHGIGFSLGSFIVRHLAIKHIGMFKTITLIGTGYQGNFATTLGKMMAKSECDKHGPTAHTKKIDDLTFGSYNKHFEGNTRADWLCANQKSLNEYLNDKKVGVGFTAGLFHDLLYGMQFTCNPSNIARMDKKCKILMVSGSRDAVGNFGKGIEKLKKIYRKNGMDVTAKIFNGMRHDILHETQFSNPYLEIANFLQSNTKPIN